MVDKVIAGARYRAVVSAIPSCNVDEACNPVPVALRPNTDYLPPLPARITRNCTNDFRFGLGLFGTRSRMASGNKSPALA